jgi:hypothetical protein
MMFEMMLEDVVSEARPGSSDGGSDPQLTVITPSVAPASPSSPPPQAVAVRASAATRTASQAIRVDLELGLMDPTLSVVS